SLALAFIVILFAGLLLGIFWIRPWMTAESYVPSPQAKRFYDEGLNALRDGAYYRASNAFEQVIKIDESHAMPHARMAEALVELDEFDRAKDHLLRISALIQNRSTLTPLDRLYLQAITGVATRDYVSAIQRYQEILRLTHNEDSASVYYALGGALEKNEENDRALEQYHKAIKLDPQFAAAFLRSGILYGRKKDVTNAESAFKEAEKLYASLG